MCVCVRAVLILFNHPPPSTPPLLSPLALNVIWTLATCSRHHDGASASLWKRRMSMFCMLRGGEGGGEKEGAGWVFFF